MEVSTQMDGDVELAFTGPHQHTFLPIMAQQLFCGPLDVGFYSVKYETF